MVQTTNQTLERETEPTLQITPQIKSSLSETSKWTNFLAISAFICILFVALAAITMGIMMSNRTPEFGASNASPLLISAMYLAIVAILTLPLRHLYRFAKQLSAALKSNNQEALNHSFQQLTACHRFIGIGAVLVVVGYGILLGTVIFG